MSDDFSDDILKLPVSEIVEAKGETYVRNILKQNGITPEQLMDSVGVNELSEIEQPILEYPLGTPSYVTMPFSTIHLQTAIDLSERVNKFEQNPGEVTDWGLYHGWGLVISSITSCVSLLEAAINEFIREIMKSGMPFGGMASDEDGVDSPFRERLIKYSGEFLKWDKVPTLQKYQNILVISSKDKFDEGGQPYQDVNTIRRLRNYFVHYSPEKFKYDQERIEHRLGSALQGQFNLNPYVREEDPFFPHKILSHGCSDWCITKSIEFIDEFFTKFELVPPYQRAEGYNFRGYLDENLLS